MEQNRLEDSFKKILHELNLIIGRLIVLDLFVTNSKEELDNNTEVGHALIVTSLNFSDVTLVNDVNNKVSTGDYVLTRTNITEEIEMLRSREYLYQIAQSYELFETYLYNTVTEYITVRGDVKILPDVNTSSFDEVRKSLKRMKHRTNNRHLLNIIRTRCPVYSKHETVNIHSLNFHEWYEMLGEVRHCITHNRMAIKSELQAKMPSCFGTFFEVRVYDGSDIIYMERLEAIQLICRVADFAFLIYKAIAEECRPGTIALNDMLPMLRAITNKKENVSQ